MNTPRAAPRSVLLGQGRAGRDACAYACVCVPGAVSGAGIRASGGYARAWGGGGRVCGDSAGERRRCPGRCMGDIMVLGKEGSRSTADVLEGRTRASTHGMCMCVWGFMCVVPSSSPPPKIFKLVLPPAIGCVAGRVAPVTNATQGWGAVGRVWARGRMGRMAAGIHPPE